MRLPITLEQLADQTERSARRIAGAPGGAGQLIPVFSILTPDGRIAVVGCPWTTPEVEAAMLGFVRERIRESGAVAYVFATMTWGAPDEPGARRPSLRDDRSEFLIVAATDGARRVVRGIAVDRAEPDGRIVLGERVDHAFDGDALDKALGLMGDL